MKGHKEFLRGLAPELGEIAAHDLLEETERNYAALLCEHAMPDRPALRPHLVEHILPGLALYRALRAGGRSQPEARNGR